MNSTHTERLDQLLANQHHTWDYLQWYMTISLFLQGLTLWRAW